MSRCCHRRAASRHSLAVCAALALSTIAAACDTPPMAASADRTITTDSAGVRWRVIPVAERPLELALQEVARITPADSGLASFGALYPGNVATDGANRVYIFANDEARVLSFNGDGTLHASWGRRGGGPGEIEIGDELSVGPDGVVSLYDYAKTALVRFDSAGTPLPLVRPPRDSVGNPTGIARATPEGLAWVVRRNEGDSLQRQLRIAVGRDTNTVASLTLAVSSELTFPTCPFVRLFGMPPYMAPELSVVRSPTGVVAVTDGAWRLAWYEAGRLTEVWTRNLPARPSTTALLEAELEEGFTLRAGDRTCTVPVAEAAAARGMAPVLPALRRVAVAPDGSVWAERWEPRALTQRVDVLEADGTLRGTLSGYGAPLGFLRGGRVLYAETDPDTDLASLVIYRVDGASW